jgi:hypothetical protein
MNCAQQDSLVRVYPTQPVHYFSRQDQAAQALMDWDAYLGWGIAVFPSAHANRELPRLARTMACSPTWGSILQVSYSNLPRIAVIT